jgi:hypothetical protein
MRNVAHAETRVSPGGNSSISHRIFTLGSIHALRPRPRISHSTMTGRSHKVFIFTYLYFVKRSISSFIHPYVHLVNRLIGNHAAHSNRNPHRSNPSRTPIPSQTRTKARPTNRLENVRLHTVVHRNLIRPPRYTPSTLPTSNLAPICDKTISLVSQKAFGTTAFTRSSPPERSNHLSRANKYARSNSGDVLDKGIFRRGPEPEAGTERAVGVG